MALNDDLLDNVVGHRVDLMRFSESVREKILSLLYQISDDVQSQINDADLAGITRTSFKIKRQDELLKQIDETIDSAYTQSAKVLAPELLGLAQIEQKYIVKLLNKSIKAELASPALTADDLRTLASEVLIQGAPSAEWWDKQLADTQMRFKTQIRLGAAQGETNQQLVKRIRGTATGRTLTLTDGDGEENTVKEFAGGIMDVSTRDATALIRSSVQTISGQVMKAVYDDNQDIMKGIQAHATLDLRTTPFCRAIDGGIWDFDGNPLPESPVQIPDPGETPYHWGCRTVRVPVTKSWEELAGKKIPGLKDVPHSVRASMDGQVPDTLTYNDWLKTKSEDQQKEVLGPARWKLWKDGKATMMDMVDQSGNALTLDELDAKLE
jgi:hypothetical protein